MAPSSRKALMTALVLACLSGIVYFASQDTPAPAFTIAYAESVLRDAADAARRRDAAAMFAHVADNADLFGERRARMERFAYRSLREVAPGALKIRWAHLTVVRIGSGAMAEFDVSVSEDVGNTEVIYYAGHVTLEFRRVKRPRWLGLGTAEEWRITRATSSLPVFEGI